MAKKYAGLTGLSYADTFGGAQTSVTGPFAVASDIKTPNTEVETTVSKTFGGGQIQAEIHVLDDATFATLSGFMTAGTAKFWRFTFDDATTWTTNEAIEPMVERVVKANARDGLNSYVVRLEYYSNQIQLA